LDNDNVNILEFRGSELIKNISILISGTTLAQLIPILLQPVLRRVYLPEDFGAYAVYLSLIGILVVIVSLKYELAIILPKDEKIAVNVLTSCLLINLIFSSILFLIFLIFRHPVMSLVNLPEKYSAYLLLVPLGVFLFNMYQSINYWLIRKKLFLKISVNKFIRRGFEGGGQIILSSVSRSSGLLFGDLIGHLSNCIYGIFQALTNGVKFYQIKIKTIKYVLKKYIEYPKFNLIPSFMSTCSYLLPAVMINRFFSTEYTGYFDLSKLLLSIPLALIATSISNVLLQNISEKSKLNQSIRKNLISILILVIPGGILEIGIIQFFAEDLFKIFFGKQWILSGTISQILVWAFAFNFVVSSFSSIFISLGKIRLLSIWQFLYFISILSLSFFSKLEFIQFLKVYTFIELVCCLIISIFMIYIVINYERMVLRQSVKI